jgi:ribosomal protein S18 acetylase RimI-like enzyme
MAITYRRATINDIREIRALAWRIWEEAYSEMLSKSQIDYMLEMMYSDKVISEEIAKGVVWEIIADKDIPCGYLSYSCGKDNSVKLSKIYIDKDYRGKALAENSIKRVLQYAAKNNKDCSWLTVNKENKTAIRAYEKNGFIITDSVITDIGNGFVMDDYIMKCIIPGK